MHTPPDNVITDKDVVVTNDAKTLHFQVSGERAQNLPGERSRQSRPYLPGGRHIGQGPAEQAGQHACGRGPQRPLRRRFRLNLYGCYCRCLGFRRVLMTLRLPAP